MGKPLKIIWLLAYDKSAGEAHRIALHQRDDFYFVLSFAKVDGWLHSRGRD